MGKVFGQGANHLAHVIFLGLRYNIKMLFYQMGMVVVEAWQAFLK